MRDPRHQIATPERTEAENRVAIAQSAFDRACINLVDCIRDFGDNAGLAGELAALRAGWSKLDSAAEELHAARSVGGG